MGGLGGAQVGFGAGGPGRGEALTTGVPGVLCLLENFFNQFISERFPWRWP